MKILLSPTKKQIKYTTNLNTNRPCLINNSREIMTLLKGLSRDRLKSVLKIGDKLLDENLERIKAWSPEANSGFPALYTFTGEAFKSLNPLDFSMEDLEFSDKHLLIFSGLYGLLKPLDRVMPYRLDIADNLKVRGLSLYNYWRPILTDFLNNEIINSDNDLLVDLSSMEYSKAINYKNIKCNIVRPEFKSFNNGKLKTVAIWSKRMRGLMARELIKNRIDDVSDLKNINLEGYNLKEIVDNQYLYIKE